MPLCMPSVAVAYNGEVVVGVSVYSKGHTRHVQFPQAEEPHFLAQGPAVGWLLKNSKTKVSFVSNLSLKTMSV